MQYIIGIDEAGRGPLAGSVYVGAVMLPQDHQKLFRKTNAPLKLADSKKLTRIQREAWFLWIKRNSVPYAYATATAKQIDKINIARACDQAAQRAYEKLKTKNRKLKTKSNQIEIIADGGIKITAPYFKHYPKADELVPAVSLASVVAKVLRDRYMQRMHKKYPHYGFDEHKGYGTKKHYLSLKKHGSSHIHRLTFLGSLHTIKKRGK